MSISGEFDRCKFGCATLADVLYELGSDHFCMERERTASEHFHISRNGAIKVQRSHHVSVDIVGSWAGGCGDVCKESGGSNRDVQAPYLSPEFGDLLELLYHPVSVIWNFISILESRFGGWYFPYGMILSRIGRMARIYVSTATTFVPFVYIHPHSCLRPAHIFAEATSKTPTIHTLPGNYKKLLCLSINQKSGDLEVLIKRG